MDQEQLNKQLEKLIQYCSKNNSEQCRSVLQFCKSSRNINRILLDRLSDMAGLNSPITRGDSNANGNQNNQQLDKFLSMILFLMKVDKDFANKIQQLSRNNASSEQENVVSEINFTSHYITENGEDKAQQIKINKLKNDNKDTNLFMFNMSSSSNDQFKNMSDSQQIAFKIDATNSNTFSLLIKNCKNYFTDNNCNNTGDITVSDTGKGDFECYAVIMKNVDKIKQMIQNYYNKKQEDFLFLILDDDNIVDKNNRNYVYVYTKIDFDNIGVEHFVNNIELKYTHSNFESNESSFSLKIYKNSIGNFILAPYSDNYVIFFNNEFNKDTYNYLKNNIMQLYFLLIVNKTNIFRTSVIDKIKTDIVDKKVNEIKTILQPIKNRDNSCTRYSEDIIHITCNMNGFAEKYIKMLSIFIESTVISYSKIGIDMNYNTNHETFEISNSDLCYLPAIKEVPNDITNADGELPRYYVCDELFKKILNDERIVNGKIDCINITNDKFTTYSIVTKTNNDFYTYIISMISINNNDVNDVKLYDDICYDAKLKKFYDKSKFDNYVANMSVEERKKFEEERSGREEDELKREEERRKHEEEERLRRDAEEMRQEEERRKREEEERRKREEEERNNFEEEQRRQEERKRRENPIPEIPKPNENNNISNYDLLREFIFAFNTMPDKSREKLILNLMTDSSNSIVEQTFKSVYFDLNTNQNANELHDNPYNTVKFVFNVKLKDSDSYIFMINRSDITKKSFYMSYVLSSNTFIYGLYEDDTKTFKNFNIVIKELQQKKYNDEHKDNNFYLDFIPNQDWIEKNIDYIVKNNIDYIVFTIKENKIYIKVSRMCSTNNNKDKTAQYIVQLKYHVKLNDTQLNASEFDITTVYYDTATKTFLNSTKEFDQDKCIQITNDPEPSIPEIPPSENDPVPRNSIPEIPLPENKPIPRRDPASREAIGSEEDDEEENPEHKPIPRRDPASREAIGSEEDDEEENPEHKPIPERDSKPTFKPKDPRIIESYIQAISSMIFNFNDFLNNYTTIKTNLEGLGNYINDTTPPV